MKKNFSIFFSLLSLLISVLALVLSFADIETSKLDFNANSFLTTTGAIISAVGFVLGIYFALLAVKAYGDIKKIEEQAKTVETHLKNIENLALNAEKINSSIEAQVKITESLSQKAKEDNDCINSLLNSHTNHYITTIEYQLDLDANLMNSLDTEKTSHIKLLAKFEKRREELTTIRARMSYEFPNLESDKRKQFMTELGGLGNEEDLKYLEEILKSENEINDFKEIVKITIQNIKDKLQNKSSDNKSST